MKTRERKERDNIEGRKSVREEVVSRMEGPVRLLLDNVAEVETSGVVGQTRVGGGEESDEEVEKQDHGGEEVEGEEELSFPPLLAHLIERQVPQHPGEESDEGIRESGEGRDAEENAASEGEGEEEEEDEDGELEEDLAHVHQVSEDKTEERVEPQLVEDLCPNPASKYC